MHGLFRQEAVDAQRPQTFGSVRLATPVSQQIWGIAAALVIAAIVAWLWVGQYTRRVHVTGSLVPQAGLITATARNAGTVTHIDVTPGAKVRAGQDLLAVSSDESSAVDGDTDAAIARDLGSQRAEVRATLAALPEQAADQARDLRRRITMLGAQIGEVGAQLSLQQREADAATTLVKKARPLVRKGDISAIQWDSYQANALNDQAALKQLETQRLGTEQQRSQLVAQLQQLPLTTAATARQLRGQLAQLAASVAQNDVARDTVLRAARAGTVASLLVTPGQAVAPGQVLLSILPAGSPLEAQLLVPSSAIGFVHRGTHVILHYQAFPYQKFGIQHGTVSGVSRTALNQAEVASLLGQQAPPQPLYRVDVQLVRQDIEAYGKRQALLPGMALDADLLLDHRRIVEWLFAPLYGMAKRGGGRD